MSHRALVKQRRARAQTALYPRQRQIRDTRLAAPLAGRVQLLHQLKHFVDPIAAAVYFAWQPDMARVLGAIAQRHLFIRARGPCRNILPKSQLQSPDMSLDPDIVERVRRDFGGESDQALDLLARSGHTGRVARCIVVASRGSLDLLKKHIEHAKLDYRDAIMAGEADKRVVTD